LTGVSIQQITGVARDRPVVHHRPCWPPVPTPGATTVRHRFGAADRRA